jgi:transposase
MRIVVTGATGNVGTSVLGALARDARVNEIVGLGFGSVQQASRGRALGALLPLRRRPERLRPRIGHGRAIGAVQHSILVAYWHMFTTGETYRDLGGDYYRRRDPERQIRRLVNQLERLGQHVALQPAAA